MGIKANFSLNDIRRKLERDSMKIERAIELRLGKLGEDCVNHARNLDTYKDQTGNLRSSIGYVLVKDGRVVNQNFKVTNKDESGRGINEGKQVAQVLIGQMPRKGYALIVVAGMNYASAVEAKDFDVLASAEILAEKLLPRLMQQLSTQIARMK